MDTTKLVSAQEQSKRASSFTKVFLPFCYASALALPVANFFLLMLVSMIYGMKIYAISAQRKVDFLWLTAGLFSSFLGIVLGLAMFGIGSFFEFAIDLAVAFVVGSKLSHLFSKPQTKRT
ncbi:hypothetical protein [Burkholderia gladioli]|uniref:hypothetical protein n=1 Tax=Burkholderia gladioli TaxID=28095 RepID=UPI00163F7ADF|nr:hypothetical protein [Burkholderia gladioli]